MAGHILSRRSKRHKIAVALQGGAALGAFAEGVLKYLLQNPFLEIKGASATSSGGLTGSFLMEGLIKGGENYAIRRISDCWIGLSRFHDERKTAIFKFADTADLLLGSYKNLLQPLFRQTAQFLTGGTLLTEKPVLDFLADMEKQNKGLDFSALRADQDRFLMVNATHIPPHANPWHGGQEQIFVGHQITPEVLAASCSLLGMTRPVMIDGKAFRDGGYQANPHLSRRFVNECEHVGAETIIVIRSWPTHAFPQWNKKLDPSRDDEIRAFHNGITDRHIAKLRKNSDLKTIVIEPLSPEADPHIMPPELHFHRQRINLRRKAGYAAAKEIAIQNPEIFMQPPSWGRPICRPSLQYRKQPRLIVRSI